MAVTDFTLKPAADAIALRLHHLLKSGRIQAINADVINATCDSVAREHALTEAERDRLEEMATRRVVERAA